jgi:glyceraldehyde 3-phosphate dehydrogenase
MSAVSAPKPKSGGRSLPWSEFLVLNGRHQAVGAILFDPSGRLLLVLERMRGEWSYPAGYVDRGEDHLQAVVQLNNANVCIVEATTGQKQNMSYKVAINGFGRIGRNAFKIASATPSSRSWPSTTSPPPTRWPTCSSTTPTTAPTTKKSATTSSTSSSAATRSASPPKKTRPCCPGKTWASTSSSSPPAASPRPKTPQTPAGRRQARRHLGPGQGRRRRHLRLGVNEHDSSPPTVISNASCTTNCITPVGRGHRGKVWHRESHDDHRPQLHRQQALQDAPAKDLREGRNAAENIVPTTTGAATAAAKAFPALKGKFDGLSSASPPRGLNFRLHARDQA